MADARAIPSDSAASSAGPSAYCRRCGYALRGLPTGTCPECGGAFDLGDRKTFARRPPRLRLRWWAWRVSLALLLPALAVGSVPGWYGWRWRAEQRVALELRQLGATVDVHLVEPTGLRRLLPERWASVNRRVYEVTLDRGDSRRLGRVDFGALDQLEEVAFWRCELNDAALARFGGLTNVRSVTLLGNPIDGSGLVHFEGCGRMWRLDLDRTRLNDAGLAHVGRLTSLQVLYAADTDVTDAGMDHLARLGWLQTLTLDRTAITDVGLLRLRGLTRLRYIGIGGCRITGQGKRDLKKFLPKVTFNQ